MGNCLLRQFCCFDLRLGVQASTTATLFLYVVGIVTSVTVLEKRRSEMEERHMIRKSEAARAVPHYNFWKG